jgi:hypothetical protein
VIDPPENAIEWDRRNESERSALRCRASTRRRETSEREKQQQCAPPRQGRDDRHQLSPL